MFICYFCLLVLPPLFLDYALIRQMEYGWVIIATMIFWFLVMLCKAFIDVESEKAAQQEIRAKQAEERAKMEAEKETRFVKNGSFDL